MYIYKLDEKKSLYYTDLKNLKTFNIINKINNIKCCTII